MKNAWKALNVDSDNESEEEIDDTKEIQIEEALKLYQAALKFHSEGPASWDKAEEAYRALFESEIFKYPESLSEFQRHELYGDTLVFDTILEDEFDPDPDQTTGPSDTAPNTLHQILHLSFKNYGQFVLQNLHHYAADHLARQTAKATAATVGALTNFAEALDKDDTDLDLWLRAASVAALLKSPRLTRFCLESVLDSDDELLNAVQRLPGLEEGFASQQLVKLVRKMEDTVSLIQAPLASMGRKKLSAILKKRLNPYPFAPLPAEVRHPVILAARPHQASRVSLNVTRWDWAGVGDAIMQQWRAEQGGFLEYPGAAYSIDVPANVDPTEADEAETVAEPALTPVEPEDDANAQIQAEEQRAAAAEPEKSTTDEALKNDEDAHMQDVEPAADGELGEEAATEEQNEGEPQMPDESAADNCRKRSTGSAGLPETAEGGRSRSKRIRARDSIVDASAAGDNLGIDTAKQLEDKLYPYTNADQMLYQILNDILQRFGIEGMGSPDELRSVVTNAESGDVECSSRDRIAADLYRGLKRGGPEVARAFLTAEPLDLGGLSREAGMNAFLGYTESSTTQKCEKPYLEKERLVKFATRVNQEWLTLKEIAFLWLEILLNPGSIPLPTASAPSSRSSYIQYRWKEDLKRHLVQVLVNFDDFIYEQFLERYRRIDAAVVHARAQLEDYDYEISQSERAQFEVVETIFELHLDVFALIKHPQAGVDANTLSAQWDRMHRWAALARDCMQLRTDCTATSGLDELSLRHIWASVYQINVSGTAAPEYVLSLMADLKATFESSGGPVIQLQNNAVMPELSIAALDRELARNSMKDFFQRVFNQDEKDPVAVIESLEPILEPLEHVEEIEDTETSDGSVVQESEASKTLTPAAGSDIDMDTPRPTPQQEMKKFLNSTDVTLVLSLWQRLREAYEAIEYPSKVFSCYLRTIETILGELKSPRALGKATPIRQVDIIVKLRIIDEVLIKSIQLIKDEASAFDCISYEQVQASMQAISDLLRVLHGANILHDMVKVSQVPAPRYEGFHHTTYNTIVGKLHDMQMRAWMLQYHLLKEGLSQCPSTFTAPSEEKFEFLRHVHYATGIRGFCHASGRLFLRLAKDELLLLDDVIDGNTRDTEVAQVLYDLYGLKTFVHGRDCQDFESSPEVLEKRVSHQLLSFVMSQARKINDKDLPKHADLKASIDKIHGALGRPKPHEDLANNKKIIVQYLKSPINPTTLFDCLKGVSSMFTKSVPASAALAASKGWYYLMGNIALNKFCATKKSRETPTEDLNYAQTFFISDLEYSLDRWETWYRLAQAYDNHLDEYVTWTADKLNNGSAELITYQRSAIHSYVMAVACAERNADVAPQTIAKVADMYADFGTRLYSSSREPFSMSAFELKDTEQRWFSDHSSQALYHNTPFPSLRPYTAWKLASTFFKRSIKGKPDNWWTHYMLGKCLWKMYENRDQAVDHQRHGEAARSVQGPTHEEVITALVNAINAIPPKRERGREPTLEPHYKLISIVHKLFERQAIDYQQAHNTLQDTSYSRNIPAPENAADWLRYVSAVLKKLRAADKVSWHHRMIARAAHFIYDHRSNDVDAANAAKTELCQSIFTKTMIVQAWRSENERPARHFVFTSRYTRFMTRLLDQTDDKANMDLLAKRVRKRNNDFFEHTKLWQEVCLTYMRLLRRVGRIPEGHEDTVFRSIHQEEFAQLAARLEAWCQDPATQHPVLDVLRDVIELKRLNSGLMKAAVIDDLIGDAYALLYQTVGPQLPALASEQPAHPQQQHHQIGMPGLPALGTALSGGQLDGAMDLSTGAGMISAPPYTTVPAQQDTTVRARAKNIGRREIQRRAEAASAKPAPPPPASTVMSIRSPPTMPLTHPQVVIPTPAKKTPAVGDPNPSPAKSPTKPGFSAFGSEGGGEQTNEQVLSQARQATLPLPAPGIPNITAPSFVYSGPKSQPASSAPASIADADDDADDESELSELDEDEVREIQAEAGVRDPFVAARQRERMQQAQPQTPAQTQPPGSAGSGSRS